ncbi:MAG: hypothetical protein QXU13_01915 [Desulfurococcaceae archaeon]
MQRRPLVIAVYEPLWFINVMRVLRERDIIFHHYYSSDEVPYGSVVYTDHEYFLKELSNRNDLLIIYDPSRDCRKLEEAVLLCKSLSNFYSEVVIGVDPGKVISYAIVGDGLFITYGEGSIDDLNNSIEYVKRCLPFKDLLIRVGSGRNGLELALALKRLFNTRVELVSEEETTPRWSIKEEINLLSRRLKGLKPYRFKNIYAAYRIAMKNGVEVV